MPLIEHHLVNHPTKTIREIAEELSLHPNSVRKATYTLLREGKIHSIPRATRAGRRKSKASDS